MLEHLKIFGIGIGVGILFVLFMIVLKAIGLFLVFALAIISLLAIVYSIGWIVYTEFFK